MVSDVCAVLLNKELISFPCTEERSTACSEVISKESQTSPCVWVVRSIVYTWKYMLEKDKQEGFSSNYETCDKRNHHIQPNFIQRNTLNPVSMLTNK